MFLKLLNKICCIPFERSYDIKNVSQKNIIHFESDNICWVSLSQFDS